MMKKIFLILMAALMCGAAAMAVPAKSVPFTHTQSDGSTVTLVMRGGEFNHSLMTLDGLTVALNDNGDYCYIAGGSLSNVRAHDNGSRGIEETAFITAYRDQMSLESASRRMPRHESENSNPQVPTLGSPRIPIILVNYTDVKFIDTDPVATFQNQFNVKEHSSLHYFQSQSRGLFSPRFDILGPVELANNRAYYGANVQGYDAQLGTMIYEACTGLTDVDFSDYDNDGDGYVDVVVVLYAGVGEAQAWRAVPESVWPCQWDMQECYDWGYSVTGPFQLNGVTIDKFAVFNELEGSNNYSTNIDGVGTFCHEFSHCLGLPDFYNTQGGYSYGMSTWSLMDHGCYLDNGDTPCGYSSYERAFMGWMDLTDPTENTQYTMPPLNTSEGIAVKVTNDANPNEYYLLEYRTKTDWDEYLPAEGILVLHVDYDKTAWDNNTPNNISSHPRMTIIPADNALSSYSNYTDTWPYGELDSLTNYSTPPAAVYTGGYMNKPITKMRIDNAKSLASFWYVKTEQPLVGDVNHDGEVNIADVSMVIDCIISGKTDLACDVNNDGEINIADINTIVNIILM
ncbi:MAG: M6 family metalloprotease domain-containing protein [Muribaculaceae bacterium]|nr:M6 family metalloprotease domain-containing protein [Muribaculaceae bacterium]